MNETEYLFTAEDIEMIALFNNENNSPVLEDENDLLEVDKIFDEETAVTSLWESN